MSKCYFELRKQAKLGQLNLSADIMRHLHTRQYLGKTLVICEHPALFMPGAYKNWLKLSRSIQRQRLNTSSADKILKFTHTITHMQQMQFTDKAPFESPDADVYFIRKSQVDFLPPQCMNVYLTTDLSVDVAQQMLTELPSDALIVDYAQTTPWRSLGLESKRALEEQVTEEWRRVQTFLRQNGIIIRRLFNGYLPNAEEMDNALDILLGVSHKFMQIASNFNDILELARPMRVNKNLRQDYDAFSLLAHRVQALSNVPYSQRFLETYSEDDTFFMYDHGKLSEQLHFGIGIESITNIIDRHIRAGRLNIAHALMSQPSI